MKEFIVVARDCGTIKILQEHYPADWKFNRGFITPNSDCEDLCKRFKKLKDGDRVKIVFLSK